jgi:hypothetical protein
MSQLTAPDKLNLYGDDLSYYERGYQYYIDSAYEFYNSHECISKNNVYKGYDYVTGWRSEYSILVSINNIITQYGSIEKNKEINQIFGEAFFFRAYMYLLLTQKFGRTLIIDDLDINYSQKRASIEEVYEFIETNLYKALKLLPDNNLSARIPYVTPCKGTVKAVLAELYLSWAGYPIIDKQKYNDAAREASGLIDSASYFGYELLPDFAYLWKKDHLFNNENVFSFYCDNSSPLGWYGMRNEFYQTNNAVSESNINTTEINFFNNYPAGYRKEITFKTDLTFYRYNFDTNWKLISKDSIIKHFDQVDPCARIAYRKFFYDTTIVHHYRYDTAYIRITGHPIDNAQFLGIGRNYILRFAQTVLTYAEAMARSGQLNDKAYECVNKIRRRARHLPLNEPSAFDLPKGLSPEAFADSVVWERAWELCAENNVRWNDLKRLELVEKLPKMQHPLEGGPPPRYDKSVYFEPVPSWEIRLNPHLRDK